MIDRQAHRSLCTVKVVWSIHLLIDWFIRLKIDITYERYFSFYFSFRVSEWVFIHAFITALLFSFPFLFFFPPFFSHSPSLRTTTTAKHSTAQRAPSQSTNQPINQPTNRLSPILLSLYWIALHGTVHVYPQTSNLKPQSPIPNPSPNISSRPDPKKNTNKIKNQTHMLGDSPSQPFLPSTRKKEKGGRGGAFPYWEAVQKKKKKRPSCILRWLFSLEIYSYDMMIDDAFDSTAFGHS